MQPAAGRGAFVVIEGLDRTGKSTQCRLLVEALSKAAEGRSPLPVLLRFPARETHTGRLIDSVLKGATTAHPRLLHLMFAANRWEAQPGILEHVNGGATVVCDRFSYSGVAYSSSSGLPADWCWGPERGLPRPDLVVFLDLDPGMAKTRGGYGEEIYEKEEFQRTVREQFLKLKDDNWTVLDASASIEEVHKRILELVRDVEIKVKHSKLQEFE